MNSESELKNNHQTNDSIFLSVTKDGEDNLNLKELDLILAVIQRAVEDVKVLIDRSETWRDCTLLQNARNWILNKNDVTVFSFNWCVEQVSDNPKALKKKIIDYIFEYERRFKAGDYSLVKNQANKRRK